jgi:hypothetical protein
MIIYFVIKVWIWLNYVINYIALLPWPLFHIYKSNVKLIGNIPKLRCFKKLNTYMLFKCVILLKHLLACMTNHILWLLHIYSTSINSSINNYCELNTREQELNQIILSKYLQNQHNYISVVDFPSCFTIHNYIIKHFNYICIIFIIYYI